MTTKTYVKEVDDFFLVKKMIGSGMHNMPSYSDEDGKVLSSAEAEEKYTNSIFVADHSCGDRYLRLRPNTSAEYLAEDYFNGGWSVVNEENLEFVSLTSATSGSRLTAGRLGDGKWRVTLTVPVEEGEEYQGSYYCAFHRLDDQTYGPIEIAPEEIDPANNPSALMGVMEEWMGKNTSVHVARVHYDHAKTPRSKGDLGEDLNKRFADKEAVSDCIKSMYGVTPREICDRIEEAVRRIADIGERFVKTDGIFPKIAYTDALKEVADYYSLPEDVVERHILIYGCGSHATLPAFNFAEGPMYPSGYGTDDDCWD